MDGVVYCFTNLINGKKYIGETNNFKIRIARHYNLAFNLDSKQAIHLALRKYGKESFKVEILEYADYSDLRKVEARNILKYNTLSPYGYNLKYETLDKIVYSEETKLKISNSLINSPKIRSIEHSKRLSEIHKGKIISESHKDKLREAHKKLDMYSLVNKITLETFEGTLSEFNNKYKFRIDKVINNTRNSCYGWILKIEN